MAAHSLTDDELMEVLRHKLNQERVKLWLPPYSQQDGQKGITAEELILRYSHELSISVSQIAHVLEMLRSHAVGKLVSRKRFQETGIATLKLRLTGVLTEQSMKRDIEMKLTSSGVELKSAISELCNVPSDSLKVIAGGRVLDDGGSLQDQGIRHASQLIVVCLHGTEIDKLSADEDGMTLVAKTRAAAERMTTQAVEETYDDGPYLQIADQSGKALELPAEERKSLLLAMTLHEKGRAVLKRKQHAEALLLLLEADKEFKKCRADILNGVDNYALVCLDIVWCYLCLRNVADLPDAERRLNACDECFRRSYGENLERLTQVKGGAEQEQALFMRLHLLQGVLAFYLHDKQQALRLLDRAESELAMLKVDEDKLVRVMELGYTCGEARLSLRATNGDIERAVAHIIKRREERKERRHREKEERRKRKLSRDLGKTADGQWLNVDMLQDLERMGFRRRSAIEALKQANNNITVTLQVLEDHPELLDIPDTSPSQITDDVVAKVMELGFDSESARAALHHVGGSSERAVEELLKLGGIAPPNWLQEVQSTSNESSASVSAEETSLQKEILDLIVPDIPDDEQDHLDLVLDEETGFLQQYKAMASLLP